MVWKPKADLLKEMVSRLLELIQSAKADEEYQYLHHLATALAEVSESLYYERMYIYKPTVDKCHDMVITTMYNDLTKLETART